MDGMSKFGSASAKLILVFILVEFASVRWILLGLMLGSERRENKEEK